MPNDPKRLSSTQIPDVIRDDLLTALLDGNSEGLCITDADNLVVAFNHAAEVLTGRNAGEVIGRPCRDAFRCDTTDGCCLDSRTAKGVWAESVCNATRDNGEFLPLRRRTRIISDSVGRFSGNVSFFTDFSLKENLQKQMVVYERLASLGELSASMVHEIGNPVSVILGFSRILVQTDGDDPGGDIRNRIFEEAERCREIVDHLLDYARSASREPHRAPLALKSVVDETLDLLSYRMKRQSVSWEVVWDVENSLVEADRGELKQVFLNILLNALHAMEAGGVIRIKGETRRSLVTVGGDSLTYPKRKTRIRENICVMVEDEGWGLDGVDPERFFAPFFSTKVTGGGLGLPTCRKLLEQLDGSIRLEERKEGGARATIELPACLEPSSNSET